MGVLRKIRNYGFIASIQKVPSFIVHRINFLFYCVGKMLPIWEKTVIFESRGDMCDNAYALFDFMWGMSWRDKYKYIWLVENIKKAKERNLVGVRYSSNKLTTIKPRTYYYLGRAKYYFFDHDNFIGTWKRRKGQISFSLWHGIPIKGRKPGEAVMNPAAYPDHVAATGPIAAEWSSIFLTIPLERICSIGYPRNDYFFSDLTKVYERINRKYHIEQYQKIIIWMPTFRKSNYESLSEKYLDNETGMPLLQTEGDFERLNKFLNVNNSIVFLKVHPLQSKLTIFKSDYSNIITLGNEEIDKIGVQLYQFIACTDALITDYSSIAIDYLLLDRPIIYTIDDYEQYKNSRGFIVENPIDYLKGYHVNNVDELLLSIRDIVEGNDSYKIDRNSIVSLFHEHRDGRSSKRIIELLHM